MLAVAFGCTRFHEYIFGMPTIEVETDHKLLEAILKKPLHQAPARLQKMILSIQKYSINLVYRPGKQLVVADALSRAYLPNTAWAQHIIWIWSERGYNTANISSQTQPTPINDKIWLWFTTANAINWERMARSQVKGAKLLFTLLVIPWLDIVQWWPAFFSKEKKS